MLVEASALWTIIGPDGTTIMINDGGAIVCESVTGWDSTTVRTNVEDIPAEDGAIAGDSFLGQRPWTLNGKIGANVGAAARNVAIANMKRAVRGLRGDVVVQAQPSGMPAMQATARLQSLRISGGLVKDYQLAFISADPRAYSQALNTINQTGAPGVPGAGFSMAFPINFGGGSGATLVAAATNAGNIDTYPVLKVWGPITNPQITLVNGSSIYLDNLTLASGEWVQITTAPGQHAVTKSDGTNLYDRVRYPGSVFFKLPPGSSTIQLWGSGSGAGTELDVTWRDAWD